jgi:lysozyme family protein
MFDDKFEHAIKIVLKHEGGYSNDPVDPGGETKYGITKRTYPYLDIKNLTIRDAKFIYYDDFWLKGKYYKIHSKYLGTKVFDAAVNMGIRRANKILQKACNRMGEHLVVDGIIGPKTIAIVNSLDACDLRQEYRREMYSFYKGLIRRRPRLAKYKNGWKNRAFA